MYTVSRGLLVPTDLKQEDTCLSYSPCVMSGVLRLKHFTRPHAWEHMYELSSMFHECCTQVELCHVQRDCMYFKGLQKHARHAMWFVLPFCLFVRLVWLCLPDGRFSQPHRSLRGGRGNLVSRPSHHQLDLYLFLKRGCSTSRFGKDMLV